MWIKKEELMEKVKNLPNNEPFIQATNEVETHDGDLCARSRWIKLKPDDPRLDNVERRMFSDETYVCEACGRKSYFGVSCTGDKYCVHCGARMMNAGSREEE
ncbi:MAG: hypothetical protein IJ719_17570 [Clostridia bacterium]|nr:hypothetical protein [Clostridia bacterium]